MLSLRRGTVVAAQEPEGMQRLDVDVDGARRPALADVGLVGACEPGDEVVVNVEAVELGLGSGGFDLVHCNLTRGLAAGGQPGAHVMKLNYSPLQHAVLPVEEDDPDAQRAAAPRDLGRPVAVVSLHGQLPCVAWAAGEAARGARVGFVQAAGGALPGALSDAVRELRRRELLCAHVTASPAYGGEREAITVAGALAWGIEHDGWDAAIVGPGPGILGSGSALGHGGLAALDAAHGAIALGCRAVIVPRMSEADPRPRHRGLSHHTETVLALLLAPAVLALPRHPGAGFTIAPGNAEHEWRDVPVDLHGYRASGLPIRTMGRTIDDDALFFAAALAGGEVLGELIGEGGG